MSSTIIACIVDVSTGEIVETVTAPKDKLPLRLKCRDHYNQGRPYQRDQQYICVEFGTVLYSSQSVVSAFDTHHCPAQARIPFFILQHRYFIDKTQRELDAFPELVAAVEAKNPGDYPEAQEEELREVREAWQSAKNRQRSLIKCLEDLENDAKA